MTDPAVTRVLVCDDSHTYALGLRHLLEYDGDIRVVDESGEDYLYSASYFTPIDPPAAVESLLRAF